jgi:hypothetical protein
MQAIILVESAYYHDASVLWLKQKGIRIFLNIYHMIKHIKSKN